MITKKLLSIEIGDDCLRGVVIYKTRNKITIKNTAEINNTAVDAQNDFGIKELLSRLDNYPKNVIISSASVNCIMANMPASSKKLKDDKFKDAVKWEAEPYLDYPVAEGLFGYYKFPADKNSIIPVMITSLSGQSFIRYKNVCSGLGLNLLGVYSRESAFLFAYLQETQNVVFLNITENSVMGGRINKSIPHSFQVGNKYDPESLVNGFVGKMSDIDKIIVAGYNDDTLIESIQAQSGISVEKWSVQESSRRCVIQSAQSSTSEYAVVLGAAFLELKLKVNCKLSVSDRQSGLEKIKRNIDIIPLVIVVVLLAFFLGHFGYMQWKYNNIKEHISSINGEKKEVSTDIKQLNDTRTSVSAIENKLNYIKKVLPGKTKKIIVFLKSLSLKIPQDMIIKNLSQTANSIFYIEGMSLSAGTITAFVGEMEKQDIIDNIKIKEINEIEQTGKSLFSHRFKLVITMKESL